MSHVDGWPMGGLENSVAMAWQPMRDGKISQGGA